LFSCNRVAKTDFFVISLNLSPPVDRRQFFIIYETSDFFGAKQKCESHGMKIATADSCSEAALIFNAAVKVTEAAWVGLVKTPNCSTYENMNGKVVDIPWAKSEPNNARGDENCLMISKFLNGYNDEACDQLRNVVCEMEMFFG
jgi:hypothetical protein